MEVQELQRKAQIIKALKGPITTGFSGLINLVRYHTKGLIGALILGTVGIVALGAPLIAPHDPLEQILMERVRPPLWDEDGDPEYILGTDGLGRDLLSRIIYGARVSLSISLLSTLLASGIGVILGLVSGYYGGRLGNIIMGLVDIQLGFPFWLLALTLMAVFEPSITSVIIVLGLSGWAGICRMIRGQVLALRERQFVLAARALGARDIRILKSHIFPNALPVLMVISTINFGRFILAEAALSFVGLGVSPQTPSWGLIINEGRNYIWNAWWIITFPGLAIVLTVLGIGLLGDWLRYRIDPHLRI